jgi:hypothetical protein
MVAIQWSCIIELVSVIEWFYSCIIMVLGWGEGGLRSLVMVGFGFVVVGNYYNSCYKEWCSGGIDHLRG